jgi:hypothetical protein
VIPKPVYDPFKDGNVFLWLLKASESHRIARKEEDRAVKEASTKPKRLDLSEMAYQKW